MDSYESGGLHFRRVGTGDVEVRTPDGFTRRIPEWAWVRIVASVSGAGRTRDRLIDVAASHERLSRWDLADLRRSRRGG